MATSLTADRLDALVAGAALLGSGGGGSPAHLVHPLRQAWGPRPRDVLDLDELDGDDVIVPVGVIGSTQVFEEKLPAGGELARAVHAVQRWTGSQVDAVMGTEGGGLNALTGLLAALELDLPFVDADLMGRALPRLNQFSTAVAGRPTSPCALAEPGGQVVVIDGAGASDLERAARAVVATTGGWGVVALPPMRRDEVADACITGSLRRALTLGDAALALPAMAPSAELESALRTTYLAGGRVVDVTHRPLAGGFGRGSAVVVDAATHAVARVEMENEYLLVLVDGDVVATCPDIIGVLDRRSGAPIPVEELRRGVEVALVVLPSPEWWRRSEHLTHVGPRAFGFDLDPVLVPV